MAEDDVELDIGLKLDDQILASYDKLLGNISQKTQDAIQHTLDNLKGAVSKSWGQFPFASMHTSIGSRVAEQMFLTSLANDLQKQGFDKSSNEFKAALLNAQYASSFPDPVQRYRRMQAQGYKKAAELTAPGTDLGNLIQQDWEFLSLPWSRNYVTTEKRTSYKREDLEKLHVPQLKEIARDEGLKVKSRVRKDELIDILAEHTNTANTYVDFNSMRKMRNLLLEKQMEFAGKLSVEDLEAKVAAGEGRWKLPYGPHREDNFEPINKALETIEDKSLKAGKNFEGWGHALKGTLGIITAIGSTAAKLAGTAIGTAVVVNKAAEAYTTNVAASMDKRRGFLGMSLTDVAETQVAGRSVGLGTDAIFNEIEKLSSQREEYLKLGKGLDPLYSSLQGTFNILTGEKDSYKAYKAMADKLYKDLKGKSEDKQKEALMLLEKQGLGSMSYLVGAMLSNKDLAKEYSAPSEFFKVTYNPYREGAYSDAELLTPQIAKLNESLKASYAQMSKDWMDAFGVPFKGWWDETLKSKVIPWFETMIAYTSAEAKNERTIGSAVRKTVSARNKAIKDDDSASSWWDYTYAQFNTAHFPAIRKGSRTEARLALPAMAPGSKHTPNSASSVEATWNSYKEFAEMPDTAFKGNTAAIAMRNRLRDYIKRVTDSALDGILTDRSADVADTMLLQGARLAGYSSEGAEYASQLIDKMLEKGAKNTDNSKIIEALTKIAANTSNMSEFFNDPDVKYLFQTYGGVGFPQQIQQVYQAQRGYNVPTNINRQ